MVDIEVIGSSSSGNCYLLHEGGSTLILEVGKRPTFKVNWPKVVGILVTHEHGDHAKYAKAFSKRCGVKFYCTAGTAKHLDVPRHRIQEIKALEGFSIGGWYIHPFDVKHDAEEPIGFVIDTPNNERILFATDTYLIKYAIPGVNHLMIECNYSVDILSENYENGLIDKKRRERLLSSHFELNNVKLFLRRLDRTELESVMLLHLSDSNANADLFKEEVEKVTGVPVTIAKR